MLQFKFTKGQFLSYSVFNILTNDKKKIYNALNFGFWPRIYGLDLFFQNDQLLGYKMKFLIV